MRDHGGARFGHRRPGHVEAFHATFAGTLVTGEVSGQEPDVFLAGDDDEAKAPGLLGITLQFRLGTEFGTAWRRVRP